MATNFAFATWTIIKMLMQNVIFTTPTNNAPQSPATPTGVRTKPIERAVKRCIFYNETHDSLDFTMNILYNKA